MLFRFIEDYKTGYVDDRWSLVTAVTGIIYRLQEGSFFDGLISFLIVSVIYGIIFMVDKNGIGTGDIFLSAALSFWLNPSGVIFFICASSLSGAAAALVLILFCGCGRKDTLRFCPFIALGGVLAYVWQDALEILAWRLYSP